LTDPVFGFRYIIGVSGTCYIDNDYFSDVIYRYSLRQAMEQRFVKKVQYVAEMTRTNRQEEEKWQLVLNRHEEIRRKLRPHKLRPLAQQEQQVDELAAAQKAAQDAAAARTQAIQEAAARHADYLARYLNSGFSRTPGSETLAVVVATGDGKLDHTVSTALANHFKSDTVKIFTSFFKPEFVSDKLFANVFDGSTEILNKLDLANSLDALLLARETVQYSKTPSLDNLVTANLQLEIQVVPIAGSIQNHSWSFTANGAGFSQTEAKSNADERILKQIASDTKMSLNN
jgi:hypothetical protein